MKLVSDQFTIEQHLLKDSGRFPNNNNLPVVVYRNALHIPFFFPAFQIKSLFRKHGWGNAWRAGVYSYHHYHSNTHEAIACFKGQTLLLLGGVHGITIPFNTGDVIVIPAGVAHKNLMDENDVTCIGAYPGSKRYDMNYGKKNERPRTDNAILKAPFPAQDPLTGKKGKIQKLWNRNPRTELPLRQNG